MRPSVTFQKLSSKKEVWIFEKVDPKGIYAYTRFDTQLIFDTNTNTHPTLI
jgi:hypothetical protein